jgi:hypothetical protein
MATTSTCVAGTFRFIMILRNVGTGTWSGGPPANSGCFTSVKFSIRTIRGNMAFFVASVAGDGFSIWAISRNMAFLLARITNNLGIRRSWWLVVVGFRVSLPLGCCNRFLCIDNFLDFCPQFTCVRRAHDSSL